MERRQRNVGVLANMENTYWKGAGFVEDDQLLAAVDHLDRLGEDGRLVPATSTYIAPC